MNTKPKIYTEFTAFKTTKEVKELFLKANSINKELFTEQLKNLCLKSSTLLMKLNLMN